MDRAHRIGQTKQVYVFRFVTENAIEERILERAAQKLRLDQLVIQQGRAQQAAKAAQSKEDLVGMIQHGAEKIITSKDTMSIDDDIDEIIKSGETRTQEIQAKYQSLNLDDLNNFKSDTVYNWEGSNFSERKPIGQLWIEPSKRERKANYSIDNYYRDAMRVGPKPTQPKAPRAPKQIIHQRLPVLPGAAGRAAGARDGGVPAFHRLPRAAARAGRGRDCRRRRGGAQARAGLHRHRRGAHRGRGRGEGAASAAGFRALEPPRVPDVRARLRALWPQGVRAHRRRHARCEQDGKGGARVRKGVLGAHRRAGGPCQAARAHRRGRGQAAQAAPPRGRPAAQGQLVPPTAAAAQAALWSEQGQELFRGRGPLLAGQARRVRAGRGRCVRSHQEDVMQWPGFRFDWFIKSRTPQELGRRCNTLLLLVLKEDEEEKATKGGKKRQLDTASNAGSSRGGTPAAAGAAKKKKK
ncbi:hypothetical protein L1887_62391 [Cichorium endivia]|nr:hypothetical protein L1887_62391 [Cichorium endivia]